ISFNSDDPAYKGSNYINDVYYKFAQKCDWGEKELIRIAQNSFKTSSSNPYSWLVSHPLPDTVRVSSNFGGRTMGGRAEHHGGLDMAAPSGTPIYATGPGIVTKSGWGTGYGQYVEINHGNGYLTRYAHASRLMVRVGDQVSAGDHIANVGCTGRCTGPHLHYEVVKDGQRKNPSTYLAMLP
ncbi:MAG: peptidoglycan DD-metalloendopeptidase family protein, partial [Acinetobacter baumannii]|nr:peptidoglycan DD-metalloendopeptidase family protein [Acinetobacter baumannii]